MEKQMKIAVYGSRSQHDYADKLRRLILGLVLDGAMIVMHEKLYDYLVHDRQLSLPGVQRVVLFPDDVEFVISVGGDGTFLRTVAWQGGNRVPVLGINTGHLGFLTALTIDDALADLTGIMRCDFRCDKVAMLQVEAEGLRGADMALNEVVVAKEDSASMINVLATLNGKRVANYRADGLVVSTPTGSTAYNLSVGGPIVEPNAAVWVLSPIAAHSLTLRPLVVCDNGELILRVDGRGERFRLVLDGRQTSLLVGTEIKIRRAPADVTILQRHNRDFTDIIGEKLMFNE